MGIKEGMKDERGGREGQESKDRRGKGSSTQGEKKEGRKEKKVG